MTKDIVILDLYPDILGRDFDMYRSETFLGQKILTMDINALKQALVCYYNDKYRVNNPHYCSNCGGLCEIQGEVIDFEDLIERISESEITNRELTKLIKLIIKPT